MERIQRAEVDSSKIHRGYHKVISEAWQESLWLATRVFRLSVTGATLVLTPRTTLRVFVEPWKSTFSRAVNPTLPLPTYLPFWPCSRSSGRVLVPAGNISSLYSLFIPFFLFYLAFFFFLSSQFNKRRTISISRNYSMNTWIHVPQTQAYTRITKDSAILLTRDRWESSATWKGEHVYMHAHTQEHPQTMAHVRHFSGATIFSINELDNSRRGDSRLVGIASPRACWYPTGLN